MRRNLLVAQSGGPSAAINATLAGVIAAARKSDKVGRVYGAKHGIEGVIKGLLVDLSGFTDYEKLKATPAMALGSCRYKLPSVDDPAADDYLKIRETFRKYEIGTFLYIGGNDSMDTVRKLSELFAGEADAPVVVGVPKTIDNDLVQTDHTPGYGCAARFVATAMREIACDANVYDLKSVTFVEIMGRDAGWLAASSALANPDLILLPEAPLDEAALLARIAELLAEKNTVMVGVSEGVRTPDGRLVCEAAALAEGVGVDEFGHLAALSGAARYLAALAKEHLHCKTRAVELSTLQRCASYVASQVDLDEAFELGRAGVRAALAGETTKMCALERVSDDPYEVRTRLVDVLSVANQVKHVPRAWISDDGMGVTEELLTYVRPLVDWIPIELASLD